MTDAVWMEQDRWARLKELRAKSKLEEFDLRPAEALQRDYQRVLRAQALEIKKLTRSVDRRAPRPAWGGARAIVHWRHAHAVICHVSRMPPTPGTHTHLFTRHVSPRAQARGADGVPARVDGRVRRGDT